MKLLELTPLKQRSGSILGQNFFEASNDEKFCNCYCQKLESQQVPGSSLFDGLFL